MREYTLTQALEVMIAPVTEDGRDKTKRTRYSRKDDAGRWAGESWADAYRHAREGCADTLERVEAAARGVRVSGESGEGGLSVGYDTAGELPDIGRYLSGEPENMVTFEPTAPGRIVWISVNISVPHYVPASAIVARGAAILRGIRALELNGYSVGVRAVESYLAGTERVYQVITLKAPGDAVSPAVVAWWLVSPAALRRCCFALTEHLPDRLWKKVSENYGWCRPIEPGKFTGVVLSPTDYRAELSSADPEHYWRGIVSALATQGISLS